MKNGGRIPWNVMPICETFKISCLMRKLHTKGVLENHLMNQSFRLVRWLSIILFLRTTSQESNNLERKSYLDCSSDTLCTRERIWKGNKLVSDIEELEMMDASEIYSERLNPKEVIFPKENGKFIFQSQMDESNLLEGDPEPRTSTWYGNTQFEEKVEEIFLDNQKGLFFHRLQTHFRMPVERLSDFWSMSGSFIYRHHVEPRVKQSSPREESFPVPLECIDVSRSTHTNLDVMQERRVDDCWKIDGPRDLSDS